VEVVAVSTISIFRSCLYFGENVPSNGIILRITAYGTSDVVIVKPKTITLLLSFSLQIETASLFIFTFM
jgi:hypothetical protein